ncbi:MAG: zinc metallopeptidase [Planctomycetota bacterium]
MLLLNPLFLAGIDPIQLLVLAAGLILSLWASSRVKGAFAKWSQVRSRAGVTGAQVARAILQANGIADVKVEPVPGQLTDHYDPRTKTLRLSEPVYQSDSVAAVGIAAHEVGHAIQHAHRYAPLQFRSAWVPVAGIGTNLGYLLLLIGLPLAYFGSPTLAWIGVVLFATTTVFTLITLPVEFDASRRALVTLQSGGVLAVDEHRGAKEVLDAAAMTYVAAAAASMMELLYFVFRLLDTQRRD